MLWRPQWKFNLHLRREGAPEERAYRQVESWVSSSRRLGRQRLEGKRQRRTNSADATRPCRPESNRRVGPLSCLGGGYPCNPHAQDGRRRGVRARKISWPHGTNFTDRLPTIAEAVRRAHGAALIDGEAIAFRSNGHSDFAALRTKAGAACAFFVAFDLLSPTRRIFARVRSRSGGRRFLDWSRGSTSYSAKRLRLRARWFSRRPAQWGLGIASKQVGGRYWSGRSRQWLKSKNSEFSR